MQAKFLKIIRIVAIFLVVAGLSAGSHSCSGPAEFTNGLPNDNDVQYDERLLGWWHGPELEDAGLDILLVIVPANDGTIGVFWHLPGLGICWAAEAYASRIGETIYYDAIRVQKASSICEDYTEDGTTPGHIVVQVEIDESDQLFLRFVRNKFFDELARDGTAKSRVAKVSNDGRLVDKYLVVEISSDNLVELIRNGADKGMFTERFGPFYRLIRDREKKFDTLEPWRK